VEGDNGFKWGEYLEDFGLPTRVARYHNAYGLDGTWHGGREKAPAAICGKVAVAAITGDTEIEMWGDGLRTRSFTYIDDRITGTLKLAKAGAHRSDLSDAAAAAPLRVRGRAFPDGSATVPVRNGASRTALQSGKPGRSRRARHWPISRGSGRWMCACIQVMMWVVIWSRFGFVEEFMTGALVEGAVNVADGRKCSDSLLVQVVDDGSASARAHDTGAGRRGGSSGPRWSSATAAIPASLTAWAKRS
jgi:NAD dependent epimerase/dehydratase family